MSSKKQNERQTFQTDIGQKAIVQHDVIEGAQAERHDQLREVLRDIARDIQSTDDGLKHLEYVGSFSVHVYKSAMQGNFSFAGLNAPDDCGHALADAAGQKLRQDINEIYSGRRQKKRSGF